MEQQNTDMEQQNTDIDMEQQNTSTENTHLVNHTLCHRIIDNAKIATKRIGVCLLFTIVILYISVFFIGSAFGGKPE